MGHLGRGDRNSSAGRLLDAGRVACGQQPSGYVDKITEIDDALEMVFW
jgi:hypothetical protein